MDLQATPLLWLLLCVLLPAAALGNMFVVKQIGVPRPATHLLLHKGGGQNGQLTIGANNVLLRLDSDLNELQRADTGPVMDNPVCLYDDFDPTKTTCSLTGPGGPVQKKRTDNINKILLLDTVQNVLLSCGSVQQGTCQTRRIDNIRTLRGSFPKQPVAANDNTASTFAFVGPGPKGAPVLYVASSYTGSEQNLRRKTPDISSRSLQTADYLDIAVQGTFGGFYSRVKFSFATPAARRKFLIDYVYGFNLSGYSYFVFQRPKSAGSSQRGSYIAQVCDKDEKYLSYIEQPISCSGGFELVRAARLFRFQSNQEWMLAALFAKADSANDAANNVTALCIFPLQLIQSNITANRKSCFQGNGQIASHLQDGAPKCVAYPNDPITDTYCGDESHVNHPMDGRQSAVVSPNFIVAGQLTAIAMTTINGYTVALLGQQDGGLIQLHVQSTESSSRVSQLPLSSQQQRVMPDLVANADAGHAFVMTESSVFKVALANCGQHTTCLSCVSARNPSCGWCSLQNKCTRNVDDECSSRQDLLRWLSLQATQCLELQGVSRRAADLSQPTQVTLQIRALPKLTQPAYAYQCLFGVIVVPATVTFGALGGTVTCTTPPRTQLPALPPNSVNMALQLGLQSNETNTLFIRENFTFYDCALHRSCSACTQAVWNCNWCIYDNVCVPREAADSRCRAATTLPGAVVNAASLCPSLVHDPKDSEILVPNGVRRSWQIRARNLPLLPSALSLAGGFECVVHITTPPVVVPASRIDTQTLRCSEHVYRYSEVTGAHTATLTVRWNKNFFVEDSYALSITVYKCDVMGGDCSECSSLGLRPELAKYNCTWCNGRCGVTSCSATKCPEFEITSIWPLSGHVDGGTLVTVTGKNLGVQFSSIERALVINDVPCVAIEKEYQVSKKIVCTAGKALTKGSGDIIFRHGGKTKKFGSPWRYREPKLKSFSPSRGPADGGTIITIQGDDLDTGANIQVIVGDKPCDLKRRSNVSDDVITCRTRPTTTPVASGPLAVTVAFDGHFARFQGATFNYTENPNVTSMTPLESFVAGGRQIRVNGERLNVVEQPRLYFYNSGRRTDYVTCRVRSANTLDCLAPRYELKFKMAAASRLRRAVVERAGVGLVMDGVASTQNLSIIVSITDDPNYRKFRDGKKLYNGGANNPLVLDGRNLNSACTKDEVIVLIGKEQCKVTSLSESSLVCQAPQTQPAGLSAAGLPSAEVLPEVVVTVGNIKVNLGKLEYAKSNPALPTYAIAAIGAGGGVLVLVIVIILVIYQRKSSQAERQYKKMQMQLDTLESNVRNECKQAFAELQTEVTDLTSDLNITGTPYWDYKTYVFKVLFPGHADHAVLHNSIKKLTVSNCTEREQGLLHFSQLLNSKQFLLTFVRTLEAQKNFSIRDRAVVASLLMIILQDKMDYATDIMKILLNELVDRCVEKKHPKLMLRRTESIVEKLLTNWLSFCMSGYLKKHAGRSLFLLYKAIKHQTEKGPVDALTSEARYSLSEDRLLREKIDAKVLTLLLEVEGESEAVPVRVLDCDTVTQAKEKALDAIYKNTPASRRPATHDMDLEWRARTGTGRGHVVLRDDDVTTQTDSDGWKRVNTLEHYHISDNACMAMVPVQDKNDYVRNVNGMIEITGPASLKAPIFAVEEGTKVWHLVKHDDTLIVARAQKVISEIFLTRLLATKGTLQQYVDDLFLTILRVDSGVPRAVKYLFDFLDSAARRHNIQDTDVVHTWKSNSLPLRFWVNIIKNPDFVFDVNKSHIVDSCLSVIAQTFMDSCSTVEHRLGKDSPSNKLLFAKDIPRYRKWVEKFYQGVADMPSVSDSDMTAEMLQLSQLAKMNDFNVMYALNQLFEYAHEYNIELMEALEEDPGSQKLRFASRFEQISTAICGNGMMYK